MNLSCPVCDNTDNLTLIKEEREINVRNEPFTVEVEYCKCPECREEFLVPEGVASIPEIVFNALYIETIEKTMVKVIEEIINMNGLIKISAGNYGGKLGKFKIFLRELGLKLSYFS